MSGIPVSKFSFLHTPYKFNIREFLFKHCRTNRTRFCIFSITLFITLPMTSLSIVLPDFKAEIRVDTSAWRYCRSGCFAKHAHFFCVGCVLVIVFPRPVITNPLRSTATAKLLLDNFGSLEASSKHSSITNHLYLSTFPHISIIKIGALFSSIWIIMSVLDPFLLSSFLQYHIPKHMFRRFSNLSIDFFLFSRLVNLAFFIDKINHQSFKCAHWISVSSL